MKNDDSWVLVWVLFISAVLAILAMAALAWVAVAKADQPARVDKLAAEWGRLDAQVDEDLAEVNRLLDRIDDNLDEMARISYRIEHLRWRERVGALP